MGRIHWPTLLWRLSEPIATPASDAAPAASEGPNWQVGQLLTGQVLANSEGQVWVLIDGHRLLAHWPGGAPAPGAQVEFQVVGQVQGQWQLTPLGAEKGILPTETLLSILEQLDWPLTYSNVERLARFFAGQTSLIDTDGPTTPQESGELCPPNLSVWQQLFGWEPGLLSAVFFTWQPFVCGLFVEEEGARARQEAGEQEPLSFLLVVDLPRLGQIEVLGWGQWPEQAIDLVAGKEPTRLLQKREAELLAILATTGMRLRRLTLRVSQEPLLILLRPQMVPYRGLDQRL
ncbi:MAG: hypothetical protein GX033_09505 [Firmicutes bacterium]|nr:hypothetical protein [Bacillota bacterium]